MATFRDDVQRELQRLERHLEAELRENPTYKLIQKLKALMAELPGDAQDIEAKPVEAKRAEANGTPPFTLTLPEPQRHRDGQPSRKSLLIGLVGGLIDNGGGSTTRQVIIREAIAHRLVPEDQKKAVKIIAPILSEATEYRSDGKGNWTRAVAPVH